MSLIKDMPKRSISWNAWMGRFGITLTMEYTTIPGLDLDISYEPEVKRNLVNAIITKDHSSPTHKLITYFSSWKRLNGSRVDASVDDDDLRKGICTLKDGDTQYLADLFWKRWTQDIHTYHCCKKGKSGMRKEKGFYLET